ERYMPFREKRPEEILTQANHLLGSGQTSLAKYLLIAADDQPGKIGTTDIPAFLKHMLERCDWQRDLHFHTNTTIDTLDYSGSAWNAGSKLVIACCGDVRRALATEVPALNLPQGFSSPLLKQEGLLVIKGPRYLDQKSSSIQIENLAFQLEGQALEGIAWIVVADDSRFVCSSLNNFLWVTFTRSNPSHDIYGVLSSTKYKHWGCQGPLIIDARIKPHHAPVLEVDASTAKKVDQFFSKQGSLAQLG
ncbi:MAG: UbiD family decarboxylase, partial [Saprospiraceae bacterium]|nr:UbiD family decarboxylase [Saprospiraceae bacterium]